MYKPLIPIVSTLTGKWVQDEELMRPAYWSRQLRSPVQFANAIRTISEYGNPLLLETGPGQVLSTLVRQQGIKKTMTAVASQEGETGKPEIYSMLKAAGQLWMHGIDLDWEAFYGQQKRERIKLPTYAFDRTRCWVTPVLPLQINASPGNITVGENILSQKNRDRKTSFIERLKVIFENASGIEMGPVNPEANFIESGFDSLLLTQV